MQIAVTPDPQRWVIIPPFPPPGWAREEARHRSAHLGVTGPQWRSELESLLGELQSMERQGRFARLMHIDDVANPPFVVDLSLEIAGDDGSKEGRRATQRALIASMLPTTEPVRLRPGHDMAGFSAFGEGSGPTQGAVVLRLAGLPTVPVDLVMRLWGAAAPSISPHLDDLVELARQVAPV
ncbi:hypothetical protein ACSL103130_04290 [Actinomyces slackii]|uniref:Uncharacterized protein n=1 Tax=Actinomyces slackii TaxID=52774 RepID=A0A448K9S7_9ACTO|nr:hypothetical protein [Actinomyces slackii]VEG73672.1 Uncharacterised protein [Actinomyces slackii]